MDGGAPASHAHGQDDGALARLQASVAALRRVAAAETSAHGASRKSAHTPSPHGRAQAPTAGGGEGEGGTLTCAATPP